MLGIVLWSDPWHAIEQHVGTVRSTVRTEEVSTGGQIQEALRIETTGNLVLELIVLRPDVEERVPLLLVALDSKDLVEVAHGWSGESACALAFFSNAYQTDGVFDLRDSADRTVASFLTAAEALHDRRWLDQSELHAVGESRTSPSAFLAVRYAPVFKAAWVVGEFPRTPPGLRNRLANELAFSGSRAALAPGSNQPPAELSSALRGLKDQLSATESH